MRIKAFLPGLITALTAGVAFAADAKDMYQPQPIDIETPWSTILCWIVGLAAVAVLAFKNARRTHLD